MGGSNPGLPNEKFKGRSVTSMADLRLHTGNSTRENERVGHVASSPTRPCFPDALLCWSNTSSDSGTGPAA